MRILEFTPQGLLGRLNKIEEKNAPRTFFVLGDVGILRRGARVSIVGSRKPSTAGLQLAGDLAQRLVRRGVVLVSGLAEGIDTVAHTTAIREGGKTIAVIGTPLDKAFPERNRLLQETIAKDHLLVSQFGLGYPIQRTSFPMRNRTMALLVDASIIVEARETSGSLSQGWEALRLGRRLYLPRTLAEDRCLRWPGEMIRYGAQVLSEETFEEMLENLPDRNPDVVPSLTF